MVSVVTSCMGTWGLNRVYFNPWRIDRSNQSAAQVIVEIPLKCLITVEMGKETEVRTVDCERVLDVFRRWASGVFGGS